MTDERTYIRLHDGMPDHPKVEALSDKAFRLLVERWCWSSRHHTDGRIPRASWVKSGTPAARRELVAAGLVETFDEHVQMHDYLEHQRSAEQIAEYVEKKKIAGQRGNHKRWHVDTGNPDPDCPLCQETPHNGSHMGSHPPLQAGSQTPSQNGRKTSPEAETETEEKILAGNFGRGESRWQTRDNPPPPKCPKHINDPNPPACRACADARHHLEAWHTDQATAKAALATELEQARADPRLRCHHGTDAGLHTRTDTGQSPCALCRTEQAAETPTGHAPGARDSGFSDAGGTP